MCQNAVLMISNSNFAITFFERSCPTSPLFIRVWRTENVVRRSGCPSTGGSSIPHMFADNLGLVDGGYCFACKRYCVAPQKQLHIASGGMPCPPFSPQRARTNQSARTSGATKHPEYKTTLEDLPYYLKVKRPHTFWMEQVVGVSNKLEALNGRSPLDNCIDLIKPYGCGCQAIVVDHASFAQARRERLYLVCVDAECGGQAAADWITDTVLSAVHLRSEFPPTKLFDVLDPDDEEQTLRMQHDHDFVFVVKCSAHSVCR